MMHSSQAGDKPGFVTQHRRQHSLFESKEATQVHTVGKIRGPR